MKILYALYFYVFVYIYIGNIKVTVREMKRKIVYMVTD